MMEFDDLRDLLQQDWRDQGKWREQAADDYAFEAGHQWSEIEKARLKESGRMPITFNRVAVILAAVSGSEVNNRTEVRFIPREIGDAEPNEVLTAGAVWFRDSADAEDAESEAFSDMLITGMGWTETSLDFETDEDGAPSVERIDPTEMVWDSCARKRGLKDAKRIARVRKISVREAEEMFPGKKPEDLDCRWLRAEGDQDGMDHDFPGDNYRFGDEEVAPNKRMVTIVQVQWCEREVVIEVASPEGAQEMPEKRFKEIEKLGVPLPPNRRKVKWVWRQAFMGATDFLEKTQPDAEACTFQCMTGNWDAKEKMFYGLLRSMRDPQKYANKWLTQILHILDHNAKGGVIADRRAVGPGNEREFEDSWSATDAVTFVENLDGIREKPQAQMPAPYMQLTDFAINSIRDTGGVNQELLGSRESNQPGILEYQRKQAAMTTLAKYFDALRYYRKRQGDVILHFLRDYIAPTGRLVRLVKEGQAQYVQLALDPDVRRYDTIVDDAPQAPNEKEKTWSVLQPMIPTLQQAGIGWDVWLEVLEYSPVPSALISALRGKMEQEQDPEQQQMQQMMQQLAMRAQAAEVQKTESEAQENQTDAQLNIAKVQQIGMEAQLAPLKTLADLTPPMPASQIPGMPGSGFGQPPRQSGPAGAA